MKENEVEVEQRDGTIAIQQGRIMLKTLVAIRDAPFVSSRDGKALQLMATTGLKAVVRLLNEEDAERWNKIAEQVRQERAEKKK